MAKSLLRKGGDLRAAPVCTGTKHHAPVGFARGAYHLGCVLNADVNLLRSFHFGTGPAGPELERRGSIEDICPWH